MARALVSLLLLALPLGACAPFNNAAGTLAGVDAVISLPVFGRTMADILYSGISGRDCSVVRVEQGNSYCVPREPPPASPLFCTHSLGVADCWASRALVPPTARAVGDAPALTPEQEADRTARWPKL